MRTSNKSSQKGITLIEILVTVIILAIGFLGLASVQLLGTRNISSSNYRSLATIYAHDIVERMRSNQTGVDFGAYNNTNSEDGVDPGCSPCSPAELAQLDLFQWNTLMTSNPVQGGLPNGNGTIDYSDATEQFTVTITWSENTIDDAGPGLQDQTYQLVVRL
ncbi:type IV pilus modification protein PilV [Sessilibacter sp. MAH2]